MRYVRTCRFSGIGTIPSVALAMWAVLNSGLAHPETSATWPGADLFEGDVVHEIELEITPERVESLRRNSREFVQATLRQGGRVYLDVAIHLKGSTGSFRPIDDKPALTLDFKRWNSEQSFHGLRRIHLNNSVEDPSYLNEQLGSELFLAAGLPTPRVSHATVTLNGKRLGLYVLKEGFTEDFLRSHFVQISDNLFEPRNGGDVSQGMKRMQLQDLKNGQSDPAELSLLDSDSTHRWEHLNGILETDKFLAFMALEVMVCHRDGYCLAKNNFRLYSDAKAGKWIFFPHGMDQLFGPADLPWQPQMAGHVARLVMEDPHGQQEYQQVFRSLFNNHFNVELLSERINSILPRLLAVVTPTESKKIKEETALVKERIRKRQLDLLRQLTEPAVKSLDFRDGTARLIGWSKTDEFPRVTMDTLNAPDGAGSLRIAVNSNSATSWTTKALLPKGHYRFKGRARTLEVKPLPFGMHQGAGLRIVGQKRQSAALVGTTDWQTMVADFEVLEITREVAFVCELRASAGQAWFDTNSLMVIKLPP